MTSRSAAFQTGLFIFAMSFHFQGSAQAWDEHANLTRSALLGARTTDPALFKRISEPRVQVRPFSAFVAKYLPSRPRTSSPRLDRLRLESLFKDVGPEFELRYTSSYQASEIILDWDKGWSEVSYRFDDPLAPSNPQGLGKFTSPLEVLSVYSDEPDWLMDDGVESLGDAAPSIGKTVGTATRVFRHFWYEGDADVPADVRKAQELDRRVRLFLNLSRAAFGLGEPYWGYRFMASALHYMQDITQPFHIRLLPDSGFIDSLRLARAGLCDLQVSLNTWGADSGLPEHAPPPRCDLDNSNIDKQAIQEAWILSAYHMALEDFSNRAVAIGSPWIFEKRPETPLPLPPDNNLTAKNVTAITTDVDARFTEAIGESLLAVLGRRWVHHPDEARHVLESLWTQDSVGIGLQQRLRNPGGRRQQQKMSRLQAETSSILLHAAELTRQIIRNELRINRLLPDSDVQP
jgi:hypothetical protein